MEDKQFINSPISEVTYHLDQQEFEGPLDLLLTMIKDAEIDIRDIFLTDITNQFVAYVQNLTEKNYEYIAEYISLAATLIAIKSSKFLPQMEIEENDIDMFEYDEEALYLRIEAYKKFKETSEKLQKMETLNRFYRVPKFTEKDFRAVAVGFSLDKLIECFKLLLERIEHLDTDIEEKTVIKERFTVADKILEMTQLLKEREQFSFYKLFDEDFTKLEMINTFLALLEIIKKQIAMVSQTADNADIIIKKNENTEILIDLENQEELIKDVEEYN